MKRCTWVEPLLVAEIKFTEWTSGHGVSTAAGGGGKGGQTGHGAQPGQFDRGHTTPVITALLTAHPNVKGIICQNDDSAVGVVTALRSKGLTVPVAGVDAHTARSVR
jgi:ABC-type sugar transport system substrate-binding protein